MLGCKYGFFITTLMIVVIGLYLVGCGPDDNELSKLYQQQSDAHDGMSDDIRHYQFGNLVQLEPAIDDAVLTKLFDEFRDISRTSFSAKTQSDSLDKSRLESILTQLEDWKKVESYDRIPASVARLEAAIRWGLGEWNSETVAQNLIGQEEENDPKSMELAVTVLAREGNFKQAPEILAAIPVDTQQLTWTTFELNRYYSEYAGELYPDNGKPDPEDLSRREDYRAFIQEVYLPKVQKILDGNQKFSEIERWQIVSALGHMTDKVRLQLTPRLYPDLSQDTIENLLPEVIESWERSLDLLNEEKEDQAELKQNQIRKIEVYRKETIPHIKELLRN